MKKRIITLLLIMMVILSPIMFVSAQSNNSTHVDHPGSENCIYSCILDNEERKDFIAEYSEISIEDIDFDAMNAARKLISESEESQKILDECKAITNDDDLRNLIAKHTGLSVEDIDLDAMRATRAKLIGEQSSSSSCIHLYVAGLCLGYHFGSADGCETLCLRFMICPLCRDSATVSIEETAHSWFVESVCRKTCTECGLIRLPHAPGGCNDCS